MSFWEVVLVIREYINTTYVNTENVNKVTLF